MIERKIKRCLLFVCFVLLSCSASTDRVTKLLNQPAPYTRFTMLNGSTLLLEELKGRRVFLMFWTSWCSKSRPALEEFNELASRNNHRSNLYFLAISVDKLQDFDQVKGRIVSKKLDSIQHSFSGNDIHDEAFTLLDGDEVPYFISISPNGVIDGIGHSIDVVKDRLPSL